MLPSSMTRDDTDGGGTSVGLALEDIGFRWAESTDGGSENLTDASVEDVMTSDAVSVDPETPVSKVAQVLRENRIHRVLVVKKDALVGIVSSFDLIRVLEEIGDSENASHA